ncbi:MAG: hypothetical protein L3K04_05340 [Thermoplasmata archaeon]|nr:hypothetical protein [Thermoplasmata archaeon]MCI4337851.1 hypothetical protein [Thermoplasmata archaeon]MCI4341212.1 hypothetical protein [Thermoplasmata archaeon]
MVEGSDTGHLMGELEALRREVAELREEQRAIGKSVDQLNETFRALALHLGIAAEPYRKRSEPARRDLPGFA